MEPADPNEPRPTDPPSVPAPGETVPSSVRRVLDRPPSERYGKETAPESAPSGSLARAAVFAILAAAAGVAILVEIGSPMALSEPLVLVAAFLGVATGIATRLGGGKLVPTRRRRALAVAIAIVAVGVAEFIIWRLALSEGGVLGFADYQLQVFGPVAILQPIAAAIAAWATA
ncbi:MAG: hypothetical protein ACHQ3P_11080 [Candidatus Limnocylindrales bacterium]